MTVVQKNFSSFPDAPSFSELADRNAKAEYYRNLAAAEATKKTLHPAQAALTAGSGDAPSALGYTDVDFLSVGGAVVGTLEFAGDPFGLGGGAQTAITGFTMKRPDGTVVCSFSGLAPIDPADFEAKFMNLARSTSAVTDDLIALTNGGANGIGADGNDTFHMGSGTNIVSGGNNNDTLHKSDRGAVTFDGGAGIDTLSFVGQGSTAFPNPFVRQMVVDLSTGTGFNPYGGKLTLTGVENVIGTSQADRITGNDGVNVIGDGFVDDGADTIDARGGDDIVKVVDLALVHADGGTGFDTLQFLGNIDLQDADFAGRVVNFEKYEVFSFFILTPASTLRGDAGANWFACDDGRDTLEGRGGNDRLDGGKALNNDFSAGADVAVWSGDRADYRIVARGGTLTVTDLRGGAPDGTDTVVNVETLRFADGDVSVAPLYPTLGAGFFGTKGNDGLGDPFAAKGQSAYGLAGNDTLAGGAGDDLLVGGGGDDTYVLSAGADVIVELAGGGTDTFNLPIFSAVLTFSLAGYAAVENLTGDDFHALTLTGNALNNVITSWNGADTLIGAMGDDSLSGQDGADSLLGGIGHDLLQGGSGVDILRGGSGNDRLVGGAAAGGHDLLTGGTGRDVFVFKRFADSPVADADVITDFNAAATDRIDLRGIDAVPGGADDAFVFVGAAAFNGLGQVRVSDDGVNTFIEVNAAGGLAADLRIMLNGVMALDAGDLML